MKRVAVLGLLVCALAACSDAPPTSAPIATRPSEASAYSMGRSPIPNSYIVVYKDNVQDVDGESDDIAGKSGGKVKYTYKAALGIHRCRRRRCGEWRRCCRRFRAGGKRGDEEPEYGDSLHHDTPFVVGE